MKVRRFVRPFAFGGRFTLAALSRSNLMRHEGKERGKIIFDGLHYNRGTIGKVETRFITDMESNLDLNDGWGATEGGIRIPLLGEQDASRPFFLDAEDLFNVSDIMAWYLLGYVGDDIIEDDGFFEPTIEARHFCESSVRGGVSCPQNVQTTILSFTTPNFKHGTRLSRLDFFATAPLNLNLLVSLNGPGLEPYKLLPLMHINSFAQPHWLPLIAKLEPLRDYSVQVLRGNIGSANYGAAVHGWTW